MKIKTLVSLVVSPKKEIPAGQEYDLNEQDARKLAERGLVQILVKKVQTTPDKPTNTSDDEKGKDNDTSTQQGGQQPVQ